MKFFESFKKMKLQNVIIIVVLLIIATVAIFFIIRRASIIDDEISERERSIQTQIEELVRMRDERIREGNDIPGRDEIKLQLEVLGEI